MVVALAESVVLYCDETRKLEAVPTSTETTFYPDIKILLTTLLRAEGLPFEVRTGTSEARSTGRDMPDFILGDAGLFVGVYGEVKRASTTLEDLAILLGREMATVNSMDSQIRRRDMHGTKTAKIFIFGKTCPLIQA